MQEEARMPKKEEGRQARTKGVSLSPEELELVQQYEELTGQGFTDQVRNSLLTKLPAAVAIVQDMLASGMTVGPLPTDYVVYSETADDRRRLYEHTFEPVEARQEAAVG
jgi:hypothetical protein